ncbi:hypothetical protein P3H15_52750 [Rhodococcus sp. T2V]|uniref:hypothetical protein n=1 Tax=Rhodococcus sp. T2V TaxID=3034164 RepID=UPI0023E27701|nr:hypothetical protein [Rhodococcus sp. T2V]MDF3313567.1 hypothetical protein [Rhodococcus sp. T2V]
MCGAARTRTKRAPAQRNPARGPTAPTDPTRGTRRGTVGTLLAEHSGDDHPPAVAYQDHQQAGVVRAAARHQLPHVQVVPAETAEVRMLEETGVLGDHTTGVRYDLDGAGLTSTVPDRSTATVLSRTRIDEIRGDLIDELIRDHHLGEPTDPFSHYRRRRLSWTL